MTEGKETENLRLRHVYIVGGIVGLIMITTSCIFKLSK